MGERDERFKKEKGEGFGEFGTEEEKSGAFTCRVHQVNYWNFLSFFLYYFSPFFLFIYLF